MSKHSTDAGEAIVAAIQHSLCRSIRITDERIRLARGIEIASRLRPDVLSVVPRGLEDLLSYRRLAEDGLAHATIRRSDGRVIVLAAANRVWRRPELKRRLLAVKQDAQRIDRRVVLVSKRGLSRLAGERPNRAIRTATSRPE